MFLHRHRSNIFVIAIICFLHQTKNLVCLVEAGEDYNNNYSLDCSFPIHSAANTKQCVHENNDMFETDRYLHYLEYVDGCRKLYEPFNTAHYCDIYETDRLVMNKRQPQSMVNYTDPGFQLMRAPENVMELLSWFWDTYNQLTKNEEEWPIGNIYVNHWKAPTYMVSVDDERIGTPNERGLFKDKLWDGTKSILEDWTGMELVPSSMYGVRVYSEGAIVIPHVDRLPLVLSAMVNVAQDVDEPWPIEVYDRQGKAWNITMEPGDMLLFEPGSVIHGRPFALKGRYHANIFIHFEPTGQVIYRDDDKENNDKESDIPDALVSDANYFYPPYILANASELLESWKKDNPNGWIHRRGRLRQRKPQPDNFCFIQY